MPGNIIHENRKLKKRLFIVFGIILIIFYFVLLLISDFGVWIFLGSIGTSPMAEDMKSKNMSESKDRKVFICQYQPIENPYRLSENIYIQVEEAWLEKQWGHDYNKRKIIYSKIHNGYQFFMKIKCQMPFNYSDFKIEIYSLELLRMYWVKEEKKSSYFFYKRIETIDATDFDVYLVEKDLSKDGETQKPKRFLGKLRLRRID